jgi:hypothetical protein
MHETNAGIKNCRFTRQIDVDATLIQCLPIDTDQPTAHVTPESN